MATVEMTPDQTLSTTDRQSPPLLELIRDGWAHPEQRLIALGALASIGLMTLIFCRNLQHFFLVWSTDENYSHGFLVPLISLYFANEAAKKGPVVIRSGLAIGLSLMAMALALKLATIVIPFPVASDYGLLLGLAGLCAALVGTEALRRYWFSFFFLAFMVPLPVALYSMIANPLQLLVSQVATSMLNLVGIPSLCEGNMITLAGGNQLFVAEACSGMRQLTGFPGSDDRLGLPDPSAAVEPGLAGRLVDPDRDDRQRRPGDGDRDHHLRLRPQVRRRSVPYRGRSGDDGPRPADAGQFQRCSRHGHFPGDSPADKVGPRFELKSLSAWSSR